MFEATAGTALSTDDGSAKGTVTGVVKWGGPGPCGAVRVFDATSRLIARRNVCPGHGAFRFVLTPGHYTLKLTYSKRVPEFCAETEKVRVRANRTTHTVFGPACHLY
jgi:hypothetical protein